MIDTDKYEGHTEGPWKWDKWGVLQGEDSVLWCNFTEPDPDWQLNNSAIHISEADEKLIADAPLLLEEVLRLERELDTQYEYIEWLEEFAPKAGDYNSVWDAYELAKGIHWTQVEEEE